MTCSRDETKILPSPILPVCAGLRNGLNSLVKHVIRDSYVDFDLGQEIHNIFRATIKLGVALLATEAFHFAHRNSLNADRGQCFAHVVQLERLDDCSNQFHGNLQKTVRKDGN